MVYVSEADFWESYYENREENYEWVNGRIEIKRQQIPVMASMEITKLYNWIMSLIKMYLEEFPEGTPMGLRMGFPLDLGNRKSIRKPDLSVIHKDNPTSFALTDHSFRGTVDICIEFIGDFSQEEISSITVNKKEEYALAGVREYFIFDTTQRHTAFYRLPQTADGKRATHYESIDLGNEGILRSDVLPTFALRVEHLKTLPAFETLIDDPIYQPYVFKSLQLSSPINGLTSLDQRSRI